MNADESKYYFMAGPPHQLYREVMAGEAAFYSRLNKSSDSYVCSRHFVDDKVLMPDKKHIPNNHRTYKPPARGFKCSKQALKVLRQWLKEPLMSNDYKDLLDLVEAEPNWVLEKTTAGYRIFPPDKSQPIIHCAKTPNDHRVLDNLKSQLKRAGFPPLQPKPPVIREPVMSKPNGSADLVQRVEMSPIEKARTLISSAVDTLTELDAVLQEIEVDNGKTAKLKELLKAVMQ